MTTESRDWFGLMRLHEVGSIESDACLLELKYANATSRPFLPAMVLPTDPNFLPPEIAHAQFVDYTRSDREPLLRLVAAITQLPPTPPLPDPLPEPPVMPQGPLYEVRRLIALASELDRKHQLWVILERGTPALARLGLGVAALLVYLNEIFVTHSTGTFTTWMDWPWQVAGFMLASIAAFAAARWDGARWPAPLRPGSASRRPTVLPPPAARIP